MFIGKSDIIMVSWHGDEEGLRWRRFLPTHSTCREDDERMRKEKRWLIKIHSFYLFPHTEQSQPSLTFIGDSSI